MSQLVERIDLLTESRNLTVGVERPGASSKEVKTLQGSPKGRSAGMGMFDAMA